MTFYVFGEGSNAWYWWPYYVFLRFLRNVADHISGSLWEAKVIEHRCKMVPKSWKVFVGTTLNKHILFERFPEVNGLSFWLRWSSQKYDFWDPRAIIFRGWLQDLILRAFGEDLGRILRGCWRDSWILLPLFFARVKYKLGGSFLSMLSPTSLPNKPNWSKTDAEDMHQQSRNNPADCPEWRGVGGGRKARPPLSVFC